MAKSSLNKFKRFLFWVRSHKLYSLFIFIVLLVIGVLTYQRVALELNKNAFAQARVAIDTVYADIVSQVGQPENYERQNDCSKGYFGPYKLVTSCSVYSNFIFGVKDKQEYNVLFKKIQTIVNNHQEIFKPTETPKSTIYITPAPSTENDSETNYYSAGGLLCAVKYVYDTPRETFLKFRNPRSDKVFFVAISCSSNARSMFYPSHN